MKNLLRTWQLNWIRLMLYRKMTRLPPNIIVYAENMSMVPWLNVTSVMNGIMFSVLKMFQIQMLINIFVQRVS